MATWLLKTEPDGYSWDDLAREKKTAWDGISNPLALKHIGAMKKGDQALIYHTGRQRQVVGLARIVSAPYADPKQDDPRRLVVDIQSLRKLKRPVTLDQIRADPAFAGWELLRISRLSVMPVPEPMWRRLEQLSAGD
jgi:predicted RNA-binding protein with PUA-like domain